jgi:hypothetical protein
MDYKVYSSTRGNIRIPYRFQCEKCGKLQEKVKVIRGGQGSSMDLRKAQEKALRDLSKRMSKYADAAARGDYLWLGAEPCSECGYIQSWQVKAYRASVRRNILGLVLLLSIDGLFLYGLIFSTPNWLGWVVSFLFFGGTILLLRSILLRAAKLKQGPRLQQSNKPELKWPNL